MLNAHLHIWDAVWDDEAAEAMSPKEVPASNKQGDIIVYKPMGKKKVKHVHNTPAN